MQIVTGELEPYTDELLASDGDRDDLEDGEDVELDGLSPAGLEARLEHRVAVHEWLVNGLIVVFFSNHDFHVYNIPNSFFTFLQVQM